MQGNGDTASNQLSCSCAPPTVTHNPLCEFAQRSTCITPEEPRKNIYTPTGPSSSAGEDQVTRNNCFVPVFGRFAHGGEAGAATP